MALGSSARVYGLPVQQGVSRDGPVQVGCQNAPGTWLQRRGVQVPRPAPKRAAIATARHGTGRGDRRIRLQKLRRLGGQPAHARHQRAEAAAASHVDARTRSRNLCERPTKRRTEFPEYFGYVA
eukprot:scaffold135474_cov38-Prasinocladus_malaysianus.AAC.1